MTNLQIAVESNLPVEDIKSAKDLINTETSSVIGTTDISSDQNKEPEVQSIENDEQVLKNTVSKSRPTRRNKKKVNLAKKEQKTEKYEYRANKSRNKSLDEYDNWHVSLPTHETHIIKENQTKNVNKHKILSPNHKLTEYFSDLRVHDNTEDDVHEETYLQKKQIKNNQNPEETTILSTKQSSLDTSSQTSQRNFQQRKAKSSIESTNHKVTEYFQIRRSERKYKKCILDEKQKDLEDKIKRKVQDGLEVMEIEGKGRGVVTIKEFHKGDFVVEYVGDLIDGATAKQREIKYGKNKNIGCYMYYFKFKNDRYCIDATIESGKLGRLVNHSRKGNLVSKIIEVNQIPHLVLFAKTDIPQGIEISYDYGDKRREAVLNHPWLTL